MTVDALASLAAGTGATLLALVFLRAAWHKAADFPGFTGTLADYALLPERAVEPAGRALVAIEVVVVVLLVIPVTAAWGALAALALLVLYGAAMVVNIARGRTRIECGCGGPPQVLSWVLVARNAILACIALGVAAAGIGPLDIGGAAAAIAGGLVLFLTVIAAEQILANDGHIRLTP